jgi:hypothetical protein
MGITAYLHSYGLLEFCFVCFNGMGIQIIESSYRFEINLKSHRAISFIQVLLNVLKINTLEIAI